MFNLKFCHTNKKSQLFGLVFFLILYSGVTHSQNWRVNQEGYFTQADKSAFLFLNAQLVDSLPDDQLYRMVLVDQESSQEVFSSGDLLSRDEFIAILAYLPAQDVNRNMPRWPTTIYNPTGGHIYEWDFSSYRSTSTSELTVELRGYDPANQALVNQYFQSHRFVVNDEHMSGVYERLANAAFKYFYIHRLGMATDESIITEEGFADGRIAHSDIWHAEPVTCHGTAENNWCGSLDVTVGGGTAWADAADFGLYPVNHAITAWVMLNMIEFSSEIQSWRVDASTEHGVSGEWRDSESRLFNIASEVEVGSTWMLNMDPGSNLQYPHKIHNQDFGGATSWVPSDETGVTSANGDVTQSYSLRSASVPSSASTAAVCRTSAHLARVMHRFGKDQSAIDTWLNNAVNAQNRLNSAEHRLFPVHYSFTWEEDIFKGGGPYGDSDIRDDIFSCNVELYLALYHIDRSHSLLPGLRALVLENEGLYPQVRQFNRNISFDNADTPAYLSLLVVDNDLPVEVIDHLKLRLHSTTYDLQAELRPDRSSNNKVAIYPHPWTNFNRNNWWWGSNPAALGQGILLGHAAVFAKTPVSNIGNNPSPNRYSSHSEDFSLAALRIMDYVLGTNALDKSFITGFGDNAETDTHDRMGLWLEGLTDGEFPIGWITGGPQNDWAACNSGETNWEGQQSYEQTPFWWDVNGVPLSTNDAHRGAGFFGPPIIDTNGEYSYTPGATPEQIATSGGSNLLSLWQWQRAIRGQSTAMPEHQPYDAGRAIPPAMAYAGPGLGGEAWCTKENAINYQANLLWMANASAALFANRGAVETAEYERIIQAPPGLRYRLERQDEWDGGYCNRISVYNPGNEAREWEIELLENGEIYEGWNLNVVSATDLTFRVDGSASSNSWCTPGDQDCAGHFRVIQAGETQNDIGYCVHTSSSSTPPPTAIPIGQHDQSGPIGHDQVTYVVTDTINGWQASEVHGRQIFVNGIQVQPGQWPLPVSDIDGAYYFTFSAGEPEWTSWSFW